MSDLPNDETRRDFLQTGVAATAAVALTGAAAGQQPATATGLPTRPLGRARGERVDHLPRRLAHRRRQATRTRRSRIMHTALGEGMTFFDNCWDYHDGGSEEIMGRAVRRRRQVAAGVLPHDQSLRPRRHAAFARRSRTACAD